MNELLVQMERFRGLMVATTNRLDGLDPACLRRFQVKIGFGCFKVRRRRHAGGLQQSDEIIQGVEHILPPPLKHG